MPPMMWVRFDCMAPGNWKISPLSDKAFRAYFESVCHCNQQLSDGFVDAGTARKLTGKPSVLAELVKERRNPTTGEVSSLWEPYEDGYRIHDFHDYQPTREQVLAEYNAVSKARSEAGSKGAAKRWQNHSKPDGKSDGKPIANTMANGWQNDGSDSESDPPASNEADPPQIAGVRRERVTEVSEQDLIDYQEQFPTVNVAREWQKASDWLKANGRRKKDKQAFFRNWLRKAEDDERNRRQAPGAYGATRGAAATLSATQRAKLRIGIV